jgi:dihydropteroate synthase
MEEPPVGASPTDMNQHLYLRDQVLDLYWPHVMGILNATPDSFSDGGKYNQEDTAMARIEEMLQAGATIIDVGGESTRPGAKAVSVEKEIERTQPIIERAVHAFPDAILSIDTRKSEVAKAALESGAHMVNDVSGLQYDERLADLCAEYKAGLVIMHSQGDPEHMQENPQYEDVIRDITSFLRIQVDKAIDAGVVRSSIVLDPGFGFGKTQEHNLQILAQLDRFSTLGFPILAGASRKSMLGRILGDERPADQRVTATVAAHYHAMMKGARILRVHDVQEAVDSVNVFKAVHPYEAKTADARQRR